MSQVDHVTSHRPSDPLITSAEPAPAKALVIEDLGGDLPTAFLSDKLQAKYGVVVRSPRAKATRSQRGARRRRRACHCPLPLDADGHPRPWARRRCRPDAVPGSPRHYPDPPRCRGVQGGGRVHGVGGLADANRVWSVDILHHSERGSKGGIRHTPTVRHLLLQGREVEGSMALALAMIQGYLAPAAEGDEGGVYRG